MDKEVIPLISFKTKRWGRSLITTCAASVQVTSQKRQSVSDFIGAALNNIPRVWNGFSNGKLVYFLHSGDIEIDSRDNEAEDWVNLNEHVAEITSKYVNLIQARWFSIPDHDVEYDLTDRDVALLNLLIGNALTLLPWKPDNTFELTLHGLQFTPGDYHFVVREMFIFNKVQYGENGPYNALGSLVEYHLTLVEGKISGKRRRGGKKRIKLVKGSDLTKIVENPPLFEMPAEPVKATSRKKDRGREL